MARTYKRDARGRFSGGGGGGKGGGKSSGAAKPAGNAGRGSKAAATRKANEAVDQRLQAQGARGVGRRLKSSTAKLYQGSAATKRRQAEMAQASESKQRISAPVKGARSGAGAGTRQQLRANATASAVSRARATSKAASKGTKKMGKAPASAAKQEYKTLRSQQRRGRRYSDLGSSLGGRSEAAKGGAATRRLNRMVARRGRS